MLRAFFGDRRANYLIITAITMVPIMGALALGIDYTEMSRLRQATINALDAANIATARQIAGGASDNEAIAYAHDFFEANLGPVDPQDAELTVLLPDENEGGATLEMCAELTYQPRFLVVFHSLRGEDASELGYRACSDVRLKNTLEVALVLDNSGSMGDRGSGSSKKRIDILKAAAKELVDTIAEEGKQLKQLDKAVQFGLVPFAASVNVGPNNADADWMDTDGISPIHHENFDWNTMTGNKRVERIGDVRYKKGKGWGADENRIVTRFTLYDDLHKRNSSIEWGGCVEMRPHPYSVTDATPTTADPKSLFVPMFAPDEAEITTTDWRGRERKHYSYNSWLPDVLSENNSTALQRQMYMPKYYPSGSISVYPGEGPNASCTTAAITPLTDVTKQAGLDTIKNAINGMYALGGTSVPDGMAWGWRVVSGRAPFTEGRGDDENGNDKVVIVLTDGENTYYTPGSLGGTDNGAGNKSIYSDFGYARYYVGKSRIFDGASGVNKNDFSNANYTKAMNSLMKQVCRNAKDDGIMVMTVALDLSTHDSGEKKQIDDLKECASFSRFRRDPANPAQPAKLFWNATGANLDEKFKEIADELSNLRIVG